MKIDLVRFAYTSTETQGRLTVGDFRCYTIEQPWRPVAEPGGEPSRSCVPDGEYRLIPFRRPGSGDKVFAMVNESLGVHLYGEPGDPFRWLCLFAHAGNYVTSVEGCVAAGDDRLMLEGRMMVTDSRDTVAEVLSRIPWEEGHTLTIRPTAGAVDH